MFPNFPLSIECRCRRNCVIQSSRSNPQRGEMRTGNRSYRLALRSLAFLLLCASALLAADAYHVIKKIPIPGDGGWDYVAADSEGRRLYVSHNTEIVVLDLDSGAIVGKISGGPDM